LINPNTLTCPIFRSERDAEITKKLYRAAPVLMDENKPDGNPWGISFMTMFHMSNDSHLFLDTPSADTLPLYEAKLIHQYDHRWATYTPEGNTRDITLAEKQDPNSKVVPRYWVPRAEVEARLESKGWTRKWLMGWRDICRSTDERTVIASVIPLAGVGHTMPLFFSNIDLKYTVLLLANLSSMVLDFCARVSVGGTHLTYGYLKQFPVISPGVYTAADVSFVTRRVIQLVHVSSETKNWVSDFESVDKPFAFDPIKRALIRAELDAYYAKLYGLTRDELKYVLDPTDVMGDDYPSETFRVLKNNEQKELGEYRTQRLVIEAWDKLESGELA
jgi:hypothetical protein